MKFKVETIFSFVSNLELDSPLFSFFIKSFSMNDMEK